MPIVSHYIDLYGFKLAVDTFNWAGEPYTNILDTEYPDEDTSITTSVSATTDSSPFIYLNTIKQKYYIDGTISGHFKITNDGSTSHTLGSCGVRIAKIDKVGNETALAGYKLFRGDVAMANNENYITVLFKFDVSKLEILPEEKILLYTYVISPVGEISSDVKILCDILTSYGNDMHLRLPLTLTI